MDRASTTPQHQGTARDVLAVKPFRNFLIASFLSNCGRWLQFAALGVLAWELTGSNAFLGQLIFAQLAPMAILSLIGGSLADSMNKRTLLLATQMWQMVWTLVLASLLIDGNISEGTLLLVVFTIGLGQGLYAPAFASVLPLIAGPNNVRAAVSLNSVQINAARVVGPAIGGVLAVTLGFAELFAINGFSYLVVIGVIATMSFPPPKSSSASLKERVFGGFVILRNASHVRGAIILMALFALFCLPFIGQLPAIAEVNLGIDSQSQQYAWFYAIFGAGALVGAIMVSTVLLRFERPLLVRVTMFGFAASLAWLTILDDITFAYLAIFLVALFYFILPTVLASHWQEHVHESIRGRIAALWVLSFGGMIPIANLVGGRFAEATSLRTLMWVGVVTAVILATVVRIKTGEIVDESAIHTKRAVHKTSDEPSPVHDSIQEPTGSQTP